MSVEFWEGAGESTPVGPDEVLARLYEGGLGPPVSQEFQGRAVESIVALLAGDFGEPWEPGSVAECVTNICLLVEAEVSRHQALFAATLNCLNGAGCRRAAPPDRSEVGEAKAQVAEGDAHVRS